MKLIANAALVTACIEQFKRVVTTAGGNSNDVADQINPFYRMHIEMRYLNPDEVQLTVSDEAMAKIVALYGDMAVSFIATMLKMQGGVNDIATMLAEEMPDPEVDEETAFIDTLQPDNRETRS